MTPVLPAQIHRSLIGLVLILLGGILVESIIFGGAYLMAINGDDLNVIYLLTLFGIGVLVATLVSAYVYDLSYIELRDDGIYVKDFKSLFWNDQALIAWNDIQEVDDKTAGVFQSIFGAGTLLVQTAGAKPNVTMSWVPRASYWAAYIETKQESSPVLTHNV